LNWLNSFIENNHGDKTVSDIGGGPPLVFFVVARHAVH
jgi:hypothetical protein